MGKTFGLTVASLLLVSMFAVGCGSKRADPGNEDGSSPRPGASASPAAPKVSTDPITLTLFNGQPGAINFDTLGITDALKQKFPYITLKIINRGDKQDYKDLIAAGTLPDIIYESSSFTVSRVMENGFEYDMSELVKKFNFNLQQFEPSVLQQTQYANTEGKLYGFPFTMNRYALFYNKDIFDKFAVPYPKDGMTWDQIYDLAVKLTRSDQGVDYVGFETTPNNMLLNNQLSLGPLDAKEDKAAVNTDGWKILFENLERFYEIPGNKMVPNGEVPKGYIAMALESHPTMLNWLKANPDLNWDVVSVPTLKEKPDLGLKPATLALFVTQTSEHKDQAFQVVSYLVSEEMQTLLAKQGVGTPLASDAVKKSFGQNVPAFKGKNTGAFYYYKDAPPSPLRDPKLTNVNYDLGAAFVDMVDKKLDVNTALRALDDKINKDIATAKQGK